MKRKSKTCIKPLYNTDKMMLSDSDRLSYKTPVGLKILKKNLITLLSGGSINSYSSGGGIPERYKNKGFTKVGSKKKSTRPGKKWMVLAKKDDSYKVVHGGYKGMKDFTQHKDKNRKKRFWDRMGGKNSAKAKDPFSPLYWHKRFGTWQKGGVLNNAMMKTAIAKNSSLPFVRRMTQQNPESLYLGKDEKGYDMYGTHQLGSYGNYVLPKIVREGTSLKQLGNPDEVYNYHKKQGFKNAMYFNNPEDAIYFAENYKDVAPMMNSKQQGGDIPNKMYSAKDRLLKTMSTSEYKNRLKNEISKSANTNLNFNLEYPDRIKRVNDTSVNRLDKVLPISDSDLKKVPNLRAISTSGIGGNKIGYNPYAFSNANPFFSGLEEFDHTSLKEKGSYKIPEYTKNIIKKNTTTNFEKNVEPYEGYLTKPIEVLAKKRRAEVQLEDAGIFNYGDKFKSRHLNYLLKNPQTGSTQLLQSTSGVKDPSKLKGKDRRKMFNRTKELFKLAESNSNYNDLMYAKNGGGLKRWFAEKWVDVKTGKKCGRSSGEKRKGYPACRPSRRVNKDTPKTTSEMSTGEKAKFKRSKTSSKRINYNHKRLNGGYLQQGGNVSNPYTWDSGKEKPSQIVSNKDYNYNFTLENKPIEKIINLETQSRSDLNKIYNSKGYVKKLKKEYDESVKNNPEYKNVYPEFNDLLQDRIKSVSNTPIKWNESTPKLSRYERVSLGEFKPFGNRGISLNSNLVAKSNTDFNTSPYGSSAQEMANNKNKKYNDDINLMMSLPSLKKKLSNRIKNSSAYFTLLEELEHSSHFPTRDYYRNIGSYNFDKNKYWENNDVRLKYGNYWNITPDALKTLSENIDPDDKRIYETNPSEILAKKRQAEILLVNEGLLKPGEEITDKHVDYLYKAYKDGKIPNGVFQFLSIFDNSPSVNKLGKNNETFKKRVKNVMNKIAMNDNNFVTTVQQGGNIAISEDDFTKGLNKGKNVFPFGYLGKKRMTSTPKSGDIDNPIVLEGYDKQGNQIDEQMMLPGTDKEVSGATIVEKVDLSNMSIKEAFAEARKNKYPIFIWKGKEYKIKQR